MFWGYTLVPVTALSVFQSASQKNWRWFSACQWFCWHLFGGWDFLFFCRKHVWSLAKVSRITSLTTAWTKRNIQEGKIWGRASFHLTRIDWMVKDGCFKSSQGQFHLDCIPMHSNNSTYFSNAILLLFYLLLGINLLH